MHRISRRPWTFSVSARLPQLPQARFNSTDASHPSAKQPENPPSKPRLGDWGNIFIPGRDEVKKQRGNIKQKLGSVPASYQPNIGYLKDAPNSFANKLARIAPKTVGGDGLDNARPTPVAKTFELRRKHKKEGFVARTAANTNTRETSRRPRDARKAKRKTSTMPDHGSTRKIPDASRVNMGSGRRVDAEIVDYVMDEMCPEFDQIIVSELEDMRKETDYMSSDLSYIFGPPGSHPATSTTAVQPRNTGAGYLRLSAQDPNLFLNAPTDADPVQLAKAALAHNSSFSLAKRQRASALIEGAVNMVPPRLKKVRPKRLPVAQRRKLGKK